MFDSAFDPLKHSERSLTHSREKDEPQKRRKLPNLILANDVRHNTWRLHYRQYRPTLVPN